MKRKYKCKSWSKRSKFCDWECKHKSPKCPFRFKYRELRNTKYGKAKYNPDAKDLGRVPTLPKLK